MSDAGRNFASKVRAVGMGILGLGFLLAVIGEGMGQKYGVLVIVLIVVGGGLAVLATQIHDEMPGDEKDG